jgi:Na+/pantothenate symporter
MNMSIPYWAILIFLVINVSILYTVRKKQSVNDFFIGNRQMSWLAIAVSIAATSFWANSVFFVTTFSETNGLPGALYFTLGVTLPVLVAGTLGYHIAKHIKYQSFYNMNDYVEAKTSGHLANMFAFVYGLATLYNLTSNLTAFGIIGEYFPNINYSIITLVLIVTVCAYTMFGGFRATVRTDIVQLLLLLIGGGVTGLIISYQTSSPTEVIQTIADVKQFNFIDSVPFTEIFLTVFLIIIGSALCDNAHYQRIFALGNRKNIVKAFGVGTAIYIIAVLGFALLSWTTISNGLSIETYVHGVMNNVEQNAGLIAMIFFVTCLLCASASSMDSALHSIGSIIGRKFNTSVNQKMFARIAMIGFCVMAYTLVQMKIDLWVLLTTFGAVRLSLVIPTLYIVFSKKHLEWKMLATSIVLAISVGFYLQTLDISKFTLVWVSMVTPLAVILPYRIFWFAKHKKNVKLK